jgi:hypothetical protein
MNKGIMNEHTARVNMRKGKLNRVKQPSIEPVSYGNNDTLHSITNKKSLSLSLSLNLTFPLHLFSRTLPDGDDRLFES